MATQGPWTILDIAKLKCLENVIKQQSDTFHAVLCTSAQALSSSFVGASNNAQYSDLTGELSTANGYTVGGVVLASSFSEAGGVVTLTSANSGWTFTGPSVTFKYVVLVDWTSANKDILAYADCNLGGASVTPPPGFVPLNINPLGIIAWS